MVTTNLQESVHSHVQSHYPILYLVTFEEEEGDRLISSLEDRKVLEWNMAHGFVHFNNKVQMADYKDLATALDSWLDQEMDNHFLVVRDAHLALRGSSLAVARLKALAHRIVREDSIRATIFLVSSQLYVPPELSKFITIFEMPPPAEDEIERIIEEWAQSSKIYVEVGVVGKLILAFRGLSKFEITQLLNRGFQNDGKIDGSDIQLVMEEKKQIVKKSGILEMVSVTEAMDDIGGLEGLKAWLEQKAKIIADLPSARRFGVETPKGAMIVGMPGCGKSLTAKATAARLEVPLLRLDVGSLMGRYVGDSEANMRRALGLAETVSPCVLWVDEIEKAFTGIGGGRAGSEITSRLFGYFLTWMQENNKPVFVLATANDVSALPPELLRKGRFDELFYVDLPSKHERIEILKVHLGKRKKNNPSIDLEQLAEDTKGFSGADLEGVVKDSVEEAFLDGGSKLDTAYLSRSIRKNRRHAMMMKEKAADYCERLEEMGIRNASDKFPSSSALDGAVLPLAPLVASLAHLTRSNS